jgi:hypothetical protein
MLLLLLSHLSFAGTDVCENNLAQDLNCNGIEASDEDAVDLSDPLCEANVDPNGIPWPNADYYLDYKAYGCAIPVAVLDKDGDGLVGSRVPVGGVTFVLSCDNCEGIPNNDQLDTDCDGFGDLCDVCPDIYDPAQRDTDFDTVGDYCDNCLLAYNPYQPDMDADGIGDVCDLCPSVPSKNHDEDLDFIGDECDNCVEDKNVD